MRGFCFSPLHHLQKVGPQLKPVRLASHVNGSQKSKTTNKHCRRRQNRKKNNNNNKNISAACSIHNRSRDTYLLEIQAPFLAGIHKVDLQIRRIHSPLDQVRNCCRRDTSLIEHPPNKSSWFDLLHRRISACIILQKESVASTRNCCRSLSQHVQISVPVCRALELWCTALSCSLLFSPERVRRAGGI